jgi:hypothetical protein
MDPGETKQLLEVIIAAGPRLIEAGITRVTFGGCDVRLAPVLPSSAAAEAEKTTQRRRETANPLRDPSTYPGGSVPRFVDKLSEEGRDYPLPETRAGRRL